jgi:curved DNA-binding protein CbpA
VSRKQSRNAGVQRPPAAELNPYDVLGVHPSADVWAIKRAYRSAIKECHSDVVGDDAKAAVKTRELNAAYEILGDPDERAYFDRDLGNVLRGWTENGSLVDVGSAR